MNEAVSKRDKATFVRWPPKPAPETPDVSAFDLEQQVYYQFLVMNSTSVTVHRGFRWWLRRWWYHIKWWWRDNVAWRFAKKRGMEDE